MEQKIETDQAGGTQAAASDNDSIRDDTFDTLGTAEVPLSLEAATRLVDPLRLNNLTPAEISPRYLWRGAREVRKTRRELHAIQNEGMLVLLHARDESHRGQQIARTGYSSQRARRVQHSLRRAGDLRVTYDALQEERARFARKIAAARDLYEAWRSEPLAKKKGQRAAATLRRVILDSSRAERVTRERLDEAERAIHHLNAAEGAMRRDGATLRLDPVTFSRFAGRGRLGVNIGIILVLFAIVALIYPPWSPPQLSLGCSFPFTGANACTTVHAGSNVRFVNQGKGVLFGWVTVTSDGSSPQVLPLVLMPQSARTVTCDEINACVTTDRVPIHVQVTTSGGSYDVTVSG